MRDSEGAAKATVGVIVLIVFVIFSIWFYSVDASGTGILSSKWIETSTSCDKDGDCTTTHTYYVQFKDSRVYTVFWGKWHWDYMMPNSHISFTARGRHISFFSLRLMVPAIFDWQQLEAAP